MARQWIGVAILVLITVTLGGCTSRSSPAPVVEVYQGKTYLDYEADTFDGDSYTVQKGDTLFAIAYFSGNDYRDIARLNNIAPPYQIFPGQSLKLLSPTSNSTSSSSNKITSTKVTDTGRTTKSKAKKQVDPPTRQAYGESENLVNNQKFSTGFKDFPVRVSAWQWPASGKIVSQFSRSEQGNKGLDIANQLGTPILAAADGKVVYTGDALRGYGNLIIIKHTESYLSAYAHNDRVMVKEQQWVHAGQQIAAMGNSGTDQIKLHFEVRYKGKAVDPLRYLPKR
ncbi:peptidoglycan DD-metalloendopeptidase family protein [Aestuariibacter salexigens]|uniref:peptidoglycan DD-metalloendopeptidase family protein n=1 Tax=Aestuariibacter salexigens TaxID=226010 RepID=UPI000423D84C|nr:peptidoglycan DD-metalloendopeptidase family protein [Aestuariibacter salexigens]